MMAEEALGMSAGDFGPRGLFVNPRGFSLTYLRMDRDPLLGHRKRIYEVSLGHVRRPGERLAWEFEGRLWTTGEVFESDLGTTSWALQGVYPKDEYLGYLFHDFGYDKAGLFEILPSGEQRFVPMQRRELDRFLALMILADPLTGQDDATLLADARRIYGAVRELGFPMWNRHNDGRVLSGPWGS